MKLSKIGHVKKAALTFFLTAFLCITVLETVLPAFRISVSASPATTVAVDPPLISANPGDYFTINITVTNVTDLYGWGWRVKWPYGRLETEAANITEGPFLKQGGSTGFTTSVSPNEIGVGCSLIGLVPGVNGSGTLASATFKVLTTGITTLDLYRVGLLDSAVQPIEDWKNKDSPDDGVLYNTWPVARFAYTPHPTENPGHPIVNEIVTFNATESYDPDDDYEPSPGGIVSYQWDFADGNITTVTNPIITHTYSQSGDYRVILNVTDDDGESYSINHPIIGTSILVQHHDIAIINVTVVPPEVSLGGEFTINITVLNQGTVPETLNVTVYANIQPTIMQPVATKVFDYWTGMIFLTTLTPGFNETTTITWNTAGVPVGSYAVSIEAFLVKLNVTEGKWQSVPTLEKTEDLNDNTIFYGDRTIIGNVTHDLNITKLEVSQTNLEIDEWASIVASIENKGTVTEQFNATITIEYESEPPSIRTPIMWQNQTIPAGTTDTLEYLWLKGINTTKEGTYNITVNVVLVNLTTLDFLQPYNASIPDDYPTDNTDKISEIIRLLPVANFTYSTARWNPGIMETPPPDSEYPTNSATIPAGQTSVSIEHGLVATPTLTEITSEDSLEGRSYWYTANSTHITIHISSADPLNDHKFDWTAESRPFVDEAVIFNASISYTPGTPVGTIDKYTWDFGDGTSTTGTNPIAAHVFRLNGTYTVILTVTDENELSGNFNQTVVINPFQNIAITNVTFSPNVAASGDSISINVTLNSRFYEENFNVTTYFNENIIDTRSNITLPFGDSTTLAFTWDTTGVAGDNYTIKAIATTATENTTYISGIITVKLLSSSITLSIFPESFSIGGTTTLNGSVSVAESELDVTLWYRLTSEETWSILSNVTTGANGIYSHSWTPETTGTYAVKASWKGNELTMPSESEVGIVNAQELQQLSLFLYTTVGLAIGLVAMLFYFLKIRKP